MSSTLLNSQIILSTPLCDHQSKRTCSSRRTASSMNFFESATNLWGGVDYVMQCRLSSRIRVCGRFLSGLDGWEEGGMCDARSWGDALPDVEDDEDEDTGRPSANSDGESAPPGMDILLPPHVLSRPRRRIISVDSLARPRRRPCHPIDQEINQSLSSSSVTGSAIVASTMHQMNLRRPHSNYG